MTKDEFFERYGHRDSHCAMAQKHNEHPWGRRLDELPWWCSGERLQEEVRLPEEATDPGNTWRVDFRRELTALLFRYAWDARTKSKTDDLASAIVAGLETKEWTA